MNDRRRQKLRAMDMMIRGDTAGELNLGKIVSIGRMFLLEFSMNAYDAEMTLAGLSREVDCTSEYSDPEKEEDHMSTHIPCEGCTHGLGGGHCRINLEAECREGGGYEAFEPKLIPEPAPERVLSKGEKLLRTGFIALLILSYPLALYKIYQWIARLVVGR